MILILQGLDILEKNNLNILKNKKVGLITNYSFVNKKMENGIEILLKNDINIKRIFTPEHGLVGFADGEEFEDSVHPKYKIQMKSLYGKNKKPSKEDFSDLDILVYDIQDVGLRYYTFIYTLAYCLETASETNTSFIVLDRVNPLGRYVFGGRIPKELSSFVGDYELPLSYGLTCGELAKYFVKLKKLDINLEVIKIENWNGETFEKTDLYWNVPSPALSSFENTIAYAGMCFFESNNISEGRGTAKPFQYIGAPWLDYDNLYIQLKKIFPTYTFRKREFVPLWREYENKTCYGIELFPKVGENYFKFAIEIMNFASLNHEEFELRKRLDDLSGDTSLRSSILNNKPFDFSHWKNSLNEYINFVYDLKLYGGEFCEL